MSDYRRQLHILFDTYNLWRYEEDLGHIIWKLRSGTLTEAEARRFLWHVQPYVEEQEKFFNVLGPPPLAERLYADGPPDVTFASTENGLRIGLNLQKEVRGMLVAGAPSTGKTVFLRNLVIQVCLLCASLGLNIVIVVIDPKRDFADIAGLAGGRWVRLEAVGNTHYGWQPAEGVPTDPWVSDLCQVLAARFGFISARVGLAKLIRFAVYALNKDNPGPLLLPDPRLLHGLLGASPWSLWFEKREYYGTAMTMVTDLMDNSGPAVECFRGVDISALIASGTNIVVGMDGLTHAASRAHRFDLVVRHILMSRMYAGRKVDGTKILFVVEEADEFVSRRNDAVFPFDMSPIGQLFTQGREFGIRPIVSVHLLNQISPAVLDNAPDKVIFNQANPESVAEARRTLMLPAGGGDQMISSLRSGMALVRQGLSGLSEAILAKMDYVAPDRSGSVAGESHAFIPSLPLSELPDLKKALDRLIAAFKSKRREQDRQYVEQLSPEARALLYQASLKPYWPVVRLYDARPSSSFLGRLREELEASNYAQFAEVRVGRKNLLLIELLGKPPAPLRGRGFLPHRTFANWVGLVGEKRGHEALCEWVVADNHPVDCMWRVDGGFHVFEVVVDCSSNLVASLQRCLSNPQVTRASVVAPRKNQLAELKAMVDASPALAPPLDRVLFETVDHFEKELWP